MKPNLKKAMSAKTAMKSALKSAGVDASCGITKVEDAYAVKVNLPSEAGRAAIPRMILGTPVVVEIVGRVHAMTAR